VDAANHLRAKGVTLHPGHRAILPQGFAAEQMTTEPVQWQTGQPDLNADLVLWAIGKILPNNTFIPDQMLDGDGFVRVTPTLQVDGFEGVFAVGDIAATDKNRSSARNGGYFTAARNLRMFLDGRPHKMKPLPLVPTHRWGSIFGLEPDGLRLYLTGGQRVTVGAWLSANLLMRLIMGGLIYRGIRAFSPMVPRLRSQDKPSQR
jgi:hypothetical protein